MAKIDQLIRSKRKTVEFRIDLDGRLIIRAPLRARRDQIEALVAEKEAWIRAKQELARAERLKEVKRSFQDGEKFLFLGKEYFLKIVEGLEGGFKVTDQFNLDRSALPRAGEVIEGWYLTQAKEIIPQRVAWYAKKHGFVYHQVRIKKMVSRWGSCSSKSNLNFNYRLVMAPLEVIDYVVIHELVHLIHRNHSRQYWEAVEILQPDFAVRRGWIQRNGRWLKVL